MKAYLAAALLALVSVPGFAASQMIQTTVEPIIGYERVQKLIPTAHSRDRLVYGARVTVGVPFVAAEAEYTRSSDTEAFPSTATTITDTDDKARVGVRSSIHLLGLITVFLRGGAQARQTRHDTTVGVVTTSTTDAIKYNPYLGGGLTAHLGSKFSLTADVTTVFRSFPNFSDNDYMATAGFVVSLP